MLTVKEAEEFFWGGRGGGLPYRDSATESRHRRCWFWRKGKGEQRLDKKLKRRVESLELPEYHVLYCGRILHQDASPHPDATPHPDVMIGDSLSSLCCKPTFHYN